MCFVPKLIGKRHLAAAMLSLHLKDGGSRSFGHGVLRVVRKNRNLFQDQDGHKAASND